MFPVTFLLRKYFYFLLITLLCGAVFFTASEEAEAQGKFSQEEKHILKQINKYLDTYRRMSGRFDQYDKNGDKISGDFYISRPGKFRFDYDGIEYFIVSDGSNILVQNDDKRTQDLFPFNKSPIKFLVSDKINLFEGKKIEDIYIDSDFISVVMRDKKLFGSNKISLTFDGFDFQLLEWEVSGGVSGKTRVVITSFDGNSRLDKNLFSIKYYELEKNKNLN